MKHLIISATKKEAQELIDELNLKQTKDHTFSNDSKSINLLIGGVGAHTTIYETTKFLCHNNDIDFIINIGISGAFKDTDANINDVFLINSDYYGDVGFFYQKDFVNSFNSYFNKQYSYIFKDGKLLLDEDIPNYFRDLKLVNAVTMNIPESKPNAPKDVAIETMEGAAVMMCSKLFEVNCVQVRSVSNIIQETPKNKWQVDSAIKAYSDFIIKFFN